MIEMDKQSVGFFSLLIICLGAFAYIGYSGIIYYYSNNDICRDSGFDESTGNPEVDKYKITINDAVYINCQKKTMGEDNQLEVINEWIEKDKSQINPLFEGPIIPIYLMGGFIVVMFVGAVIITKWK